MKLFSYFNVLQLVCIFMHRWRQIHLTLGSCSEISNSLPYMELLLTSSPVLAVDFFPRAISPNKTAAYLPLHESCRYLTVSRKPMSVWYLCSNGLGSSPGVPPASPDPCSLDMAIFFLILIDFSYGYCLLWIVFYIRDKKMNLVKITVPSEFAF